MAGVEELVIALETYIQLATDEREARNQYGGYSWDYHGAHLIADTRKAREKLTATLNEYIDARVAKALASEPR